MMFGEPQTLIVVYKDELMLNQLKKLVETNDDNDEENVIGTRDGSVRIVAWTEKVWADQKKAGNINNKVLFLGDVKDVDKLLPVIDIKFDSFGVKYGWAGNQAVLCCDVWQLNKAEVYNQFLYELNKLPLPEILKSEARKVREEQQEDNSKKGFFGKLGSSIVKTAKKISNKVQDAVETNNDKVKKQQYFYGVYNLYAQHLEEFMNK